MEEDKKEKNYYASTGTVVTTGIITTNDTKYSVTWGNTCTHPKSKDMFIPTKVIYNPPYTICYFPDGSKEIAICGEDEEYSREFGVMACITKHLMSRGAFKRLVESGWEQPKIEETKKETISNFPIKTMPDMKSAEEALKEINKMIKEVQKYQKDQWG